MRFGQAREFLGLAATFAGCRVVKRGIGGAVATAVVVVAGSAWAGERDSVRVYDVKITGSMTVRDVGAVSIWRWSHVYHGVRFVFEPVSSGGQMSFMLTTKPRGTRGEISGTVAYRDASSTTTCTWSRTFRKTGSFDLLGTPSEGAVRYHLSLNVSGEGGHPLITDAPACTARTYFGDVSVPNYPNAVYAHFDPANTQIEQKFRRVQLPRQATSPLNRLVHGRGVILMLRGSSDDGGGGAEGIERIVFTPRKGTPGG